MKYEYKLEQYNVRSCEARVVFLKTLSPIKTITRLKI